MLIDFSVSPQFWLGLQTEDDLNVASDKLGDRLECEVHPRPAFGPAD